MTSTDLFASQHLFDKHGVHYPLIRSWEMMPPKGGWSVSIMANGRKTLVEGRPRRIAEMIYMTYNLAGKPVSMDKIWDFLNMTWISRDPSRYSGNDPKAISESKIPEYIDFDYLALLSMAANKFDKALWDMAISLTKDNSDPSLKGEYANEEFFHSFTKARLQIPEVESLEDAHKFLALLK